MLPWRGFSSASYPPRIPGGYAIWRLVAGRTMWGPQWGGSSSTRRVICTKRRTASNTMRINWPSWGDYSHWFTETLPRPPGTPIRWVPVNRKPWTSSWPMNASCKRKKLASATPGFKAGMRLIAMRLGPPPPGTDMLRPHHQRHPGLPPPLVVVARTLSPSRLWPLRKEHLCLSWNKKGRETWTQESQGAPPGQWTWMHGYFYVTINHHPRRRRDPSPPIGGSAPAPVIINTDRDSDNTQELKVTFGTRLEPDPCSTMGLYPLPYICWPLKIVVFFFPVIYVLFTIRNCTSLSTLPLWPCITLLTDCECVTLYQFFVWIPVTVYLVSRCILKKPYQRIPCVASVLLQRLKIGTAVNLTNRALLSSLLRIQWLLIGLRP